MNAASRWMFCWKFFFNLCFLFLHNVLTLFTLCAVIPMLKGFSAIYLKLFTIAYGLLPFKSVVDVVSLSTLYPIVVEW